MKYKFNGKIYKKGGGNGTSYGNLLFDIFRYYLINNPNKSYYEIQSLFNPLHTAYSGKNSSKKVVFNEKDFKEWYKQSSSDSKRDDRYFDLTKYNNDNLYFTTQWGNTQGNIDRFIDFAITDLGYNIEQISNNEEDEFINSFKSFIETLPLKGGNKYAKLYTEARNQPFKVYRNGQGSIVVHAFTNHSTSMVITLNQFLKVLFEQGQYLYSSYEPILMTRIKNNNYIQLNEIEIENEINLTKNIILYGAPGIGKTHNYQNLIVQLENERPEQEIFSNIKLNKEVKLNHPIFQDIENEERIKFVTFHQSYSYEDFIEGFRPNPHANIELQDGIFKEIVTNALNEQEKNFYLVIDEINRGNISKIFGELITLIEEDKRDTYEVTLPYSKEKFKIPSNLYIIATMNSTDKSIATIDIALRRRFTFLKMLPNENLIDFPHAKNLFNSLNEYIKENLNEDYMLGHSYFMKVQNNESLEFVKEYKIKPLLEEYFYADDTKLKEVIELLNGVVND
ncbi:McrB family protein [Sulfurimonas sp.]